MWTASCTARERKQNGTQPVGDYYKLCAVFSSSSEVIYTQVSTSLSTRSLISSGEIMLASRRVEDYLRLIKEIHVRQKEMAQHKKKLGQVDSEARDIRVSGFFFASVIHYQPLYFLIKAGGDASAAPKRSYARSETERAIKLIKGTDEAIRPT